MGFCQLKNAHTFEDNELLVVKLKFLFLQSLRDEWDQIQAQLHRQLSYILWTIRILGVTYFSFLLCFFLYAHPLYVSHALRLRLLFVTAFGKIPILYVWYQLLMDDRLCAQSQSYILLVQTQ